LLDIDTVDSHVEANEHTSEGPKSILPFMQYIDNSIKGNDLVMTALADLNNDKLSDIIVTNGSYPPHESIAYAPYVLINKGSEYDRVNIEGIPPMTHTREIAVSDFNLDGIKDFIIVGHGYDTVPFPGEQNSLIYGQANSSFVDRSDLLPALSDFSHSVAIGDLNGDQYPDIYVGNVSGFESIPPYILINEGGDSFRKLDLPSDNFSLYEAKYSSSLIYDLDRDGISELIVGTDSSYESPSKVFSLNPETEVLTEIHSLSGGTFGDNNLTLDIKAGDINGDERSDLLFLSTFNLTHQGVGMGIFIQSEDGSFIDETTVRLPDLDSEQNWFAFIELIDFDEDGDLDILTTQLPNRGPVRYQNDGDGNFVGIEGSFLLNGMDFYNSSIDSEFGIISAFHSSNGSVTIDQIVY
jgi:hypothetical protein